MTSVPRRDRLSTIRLKSRVLALASILVCAVFAQLALAGIASAAGCNDNWTNAAGGSWTTPTNWSTGVVPGSSSDACITLAGNYTVTLQGAPGQIHSLTLGSPSGSTTQTLAVQGVPGQNSTLSFATNSTVAATGQLTLDSQVNGGFANLVGASAATLSNSGTVNSQVEGSDNNYLEANLTNSGTVDVKSGELRQDQATTTTNNGTFKVDVGASPDYTITNSGAFINNAGGSVADNGAITLTNGSSWSQHGGSESGNAVTLNNSCSLTDTGNGSSGQFDVFSAVSVSGTIAAGETLSVLGTPGNNSTATLPSAVTNNGTIVLDSQVNGGYANISGSPLTNNGTFDSQVEGSDNDFLEVNLTNNAGHTVDVKSGELRQDEATTTTNNGTFKVDPGASPGYTVTDSSASFVNNGSVSNGGAITLSNGSSWSQHGGSETGSPVLLLNNCNLADTGTGSSGQFNLIGTVNFSGTIASGETVSVLGTPGNNSSAILASAITNNGKIVLDSQANAGYARISGATVTNNGTFDSQVEGSNTDFLESNLINNGTVEDISGELRQDLGTTTTNKATFLVDTGTNPGAFTITSSTASFLNDAGASVTDSGSITLTNGSSWSQVGGKETGGTVALDNTCSLIDNGSGSSGKFSIFDTVSVSGTIASAETVSVLGIPGHNSDASLVGTVTNNGTIVLDSQANGGYADISGNPLTNNGTINTQVEGPSLDYLEANLTNSSTGTVEVKSGELRQDEATTTTNNGTFIVDAGASPGFTLPTSVASFVNNGSVSNGGAITLTGGSTWSAHGGSETGAPVALQGSSALVDTGTGTSGQFTIVDTSPVSGTIAAGETVTVIGIPGHNSSMSSSAPGVTNDGTIVLDTQANGGFAELQGSPLTNNGTLNSQSEGGNGDFLGANLANAGTVEVKTGQLAQDTTTTTTNDGNVILNVGAQFGLTSGGAVFNQQSDGTMTFDISGASSFGTLNLVSGATFNLNGGTANPILQGGYAPAVGTEFDVIVGAHGAGTFTTVNNDFTGDYAHAGFVGLIRGRDSTSTVVTSSTNPSTFGQSVTFTATITPALGGVGNPTGTVTFFDNGTSIGTGTVSTTAGVTKATLTTSTLAVGTHPITASYGGDGNYKPSPVSSPALSQVVNKATTTTAVKSSLNPSTVGQSVTFTATVTKASGTPNPTGTVTFLDNGTSIGTGSLSTAAGVTTATLTTSSLSQGTHPITASYGGDGNYSGSTSSPALNQLVNAKAATGTTTAVKSSLNPSTVGQSVTFTATITPGAGGTGNPTGTVTFLDNGTSIGTGTVSTTAGVTTATLSTSSLSQGTHPITASYGGDSNYSGSTSSPALNQVVNAKAATGTSTAVKSSLNPSTVGQSVTFTATITPGAGGTGNPTGTVTFLDNGTSIGTGTVSTAAGVTTATLTTSTLAAGTHPITASYGGDSNYNGSTSSPALSQVVNKASSSTAVASSMNPSNVGQPVTFTATITPGAGGTANPTGTVTFLDNGTSIGTGTVSTTAGVTTAALTTSTLGAGTHPITASYGGDGNYSGSTSSPALSQVVNSLPTGGCTMSSMSNVTTFSASGQSIHIENALDSNVSNTQHLVLRSLTGTAQYFALEKLTAATCSDNPNFQLGSGDSFNTITADGPGSFGTAQFHTTPGYTIHIVIGDLGHNGNTDNPLLDQVTFTIKNPQGVVVWTGSGNLTAGNEQEVG